ncbi:MAG TPA: hypothetical protein VIG25_15455 [Pyrinomonadaceae bacterium]|jgi:hypothetical protein
MVLSEWLFQNIAPLDTNPRLEYFGEYLIPIAAIILLVVVEIWEEIAVGVRLVKLFITRMLVRR